MALDPGPKKSKPKKGPLKLLKYHKHVPVVKKKRKQKFDKKRRA